jgi:hypothetical protein
MIEFYPCFDLCGKQDALFLKFDTLPQDTHPLGYTGERLQGLV